MFNSSTAQKESFLLVRLAEKLGKSPRRDSHNNKYAIKQSICSLNVVF